MRHHVDLRLFAAALIAIVATASVQASDLFSADDGPLEITADSAELTRDGTMRYVGNVEFRNERLNVRGDRLTLTQDGSEGLIIRIQGDPAVLSHHPAEGDDMRPVEAVAERIRFLRNDNVVELEGAVEMTRGGDRLSGNTLRYEVANQRIQASGGEAGRVRITIDPETLRQSRP